ncbi:hypothetical protein DEO72_LG1g2837 [Vigna unguiculata]|uniref:Uncharacterized protein n=1 Tax=Vigna unguiculata TaxID=3917 RepID=A0A4D6KNG3_VIGUN|nr:hypothetical protein DEO72_LG1g2837 [Vigna unguiculata]
MNCRQATHLLMLVFWVPERNHLARKALEGREGFPAGAANSGKLAGIPCTAWRLRVCRQTPTQRQWVCVAAGYGDGLQRNQKCACTNIAPGGGFRPPGNSNNVSGVWYEFCQAVKVDLLGAWRLAVRVPCHVVWKLVVPSGMIYKAFGDASKVWQQVTLGSPYLPVFGDDRVRGTPADVDAGGAGDT